MNLSDRTLLILFLFPCFAVFSILVVFPVVYAFWLSFNEYSIGFKLVGTFVGYKNYAELLGKPIFVKAFSNTLFYTSTTTCLQLIVGLGVALLANENFRGRTIVRALILFPYVCPLVVAALTFKWMFNQSWGIMNYLLMSVGFIDAPKSWLSTLPEAWIVIILTDVWAFYPFVALSLLARLQVIPQTLYDAAKVDGASVWGRFRHVTLPQLLSVVYLVLLVRIIWMMNKFDTIWVITQGGPAGATTTIPIFTWINLHSFKVGEASAAAIYSFFLLVVLLFLYIRTYARGE